LLSGSLYSLRGLKVEILAEKEIRNTVITPGNFRVTVIITARMRDLETPARMFDLNQPMQRKQRTLMS